MAIYKRDIANINLETGNIHRTFLNHSIGYMDQKADHFGIRVFRNGEPVDLTGVSVQGVFMPPQGSPIAITGSTYTIVSGNTAEVILPQACYNYDGQFTLAIKLVDSTNSVTGTMRIVDGMVDNTHASGTVAPTSAVPTYQEILSTYDDMVAATAAANGAIAPLYANLTFPVKAGQYAIVDGALKRAIVDIATSEAYTAAHWTNAKLGPDLCDVKSALSYASESTESDIERITGNRALIFSQGFYGTASIQYTGEVYWQPSVNFVTAICPCVPGDKFSIKINGSTGVTRGYYFADSNMQHVSHWTSSGDLESGITAPSNAAYFCVNNRITSLPKGYYAYKGIPIGEKVVAANNRITQIEETLLQADEWIEMPFKITDGYFIRYTDGTIGASDTASITDFISIDFYDQLYYKRRTSTSSSGSAGIAFYNNDFECIGGESSLFNQETNEYVWQMIAVPENASYVRCTMFSDTTTYGNFEIKGHSQIGKFLSDVTDTIYYPITEQEGIAYGGMTSKGVSTTSPRRLRYLFDEKGAVNVKAGSTITPNDGYKFAVALYSSYNSNSDFVLIDYIAMRTTTYTIPYNCFIRITFGTTDNDILWSKDDEGQITLTEEGAAAAAGALVLNLIGGTLKEEIENIESRTLSDIWDEVNRLETDIPLNALAYHALFDDLVTNGKLTRTLIGKQDNDDDYPIYLYTLRNDMSHLNSSYKIIQWNGSNELYNRPKIWLDSGIHGNERTTPYVLFDFINKLCTKIEYQEMRNAFDWYIVPLVNPWGFSNSAIKTSTGVLDNGSTYNSSNKDQYTIVANNSTTHQGIRRNKDGIDINRDFSDFVTDEAQMLRDLLDDLTEDDRDFIFAIDSHQATAGDDVNVIGAFMSLNYSASAADKAFMWGKWMQAGAKTEMLIANDTDRDLVQSVYSWASTNNPTARNFLKNYADYAMCFEGGQTCLYYSQSQVWSNPVARNFSNTQYQLFLHILTQHWMV